MTYDGHLRLGKYKVEDEEFDWLKQQKRYFGQAGAIAYGNYDADEDSKAHIYLGGAVDRGKYRDCAATPGGGAPGCSAD